VDGRDKPGHDRDASVSAIRSGKFQRLAALLAREVMSKSFPSLEGDGAPKSAI
jgi:hypothetical protein